MTSLRGRVVAQDIGDLLRPLPIGVVGSIRQPLDGDRPWRACRAHREKPPASPRRGGGGLRAAASPAGGEQGADACGAARSEEASSGEGSGDPGLRHGRVFLSLSKGRVKELDSEVRLT